MAPQIKEPNIDLHFGRVNIAASDLEQVETVLIEYSNETVDERNRDIYGYEIETPTHMFDSVADLETLGLNAISTLKMTAGKPPIFVNFAPSGASVYCISPSPRSLSCASKLEIVLKPRKRPKIEDFMGHNTSIILTLWALYAIAASSYLLLLPESVKDRTSSAYLGFIVGLLLTYGFFLFRSKPKPAITLHPNTQTFLHRWQSEISISVAVIGVFVAIIGLVTR